MVVKRKSIEINLSSVIVFCFYEFYSFLKLEIIMIYVVLGF